MRVSDDARRASPAAVAATRRSKPAAFVALTKPRIVELLLITTVPSMFLAERGLPSLWLMTATIVGGALAAGGANAANMYLDRDIDRLMERTRGRPVATGEISPAEAAAFASALSVAAFAWLWAFVNLLSAALAAAAAVFYVVVYTVWLKRRRSSNIVIGGAAGAAPVLVGWTAVTDSLDWPPLVLFAIIFYWTPPHFWALAIRYRSDYQAADVPMLPAVASLASTARRIVAYAFVLWGLTLALVPVAGMGLVYTVSAAVLGAGFCSLALRLLRRLDARSSMQLFGWSNAYVTALFAMIAVDVIVSHGP